MECFVHIVPNESLLKMFVGAEQCGNGDIAPLYMICSPCLFQVLNTLVLLSLLSLSFMCVAPDLQNQDPLDASKKRLHECGFCHKEEMEPKTFKRCQR